MRFLMVHRLDERDPAAWNPTPEFIERMGAFVQDWADRGILITAEGVHPSEKGALVRRTRAGSTTVTDGPFAEAKEVIAGFWIIEVGSLAEAVAWAQRSPISRCLDEGQEAGEIEVRQVFDGLTPDAPEGRRAAQD